jgi:hypothetical protein
MHWISESPKWMITAVLALILRRVHNCRSNQVYEQPRTLQLANRILRRVRQLHLPHWQREEGREMTTAVMSDSISLEYEEKPTRKLFTGVMEAKHRGQEFQQLCADIGRALDKVERLQVCELGPRGRRPYDGAMPDIASEVFNPVVDPALQCAYGDRHSRALEHVTSRIRRSCERGLFSGDTLENLWVCKKAWLTDLLTALH